MNIRNNRVYWSESDIAFMRENCEMGYQFFAEHYAVKKSYVKTAFKRNKITTRKKIVFAPFEREEIARLYAHTPTAVIAQILDRPEESIYRQAYNMGLKKSPEYLKAEWARVSKNLTDGGMAYRFAKGHAPANKGKKMPDDVREKVKHTWFKKGQQSPNTKYDGYVSLRKDKMGNTYAHVRVAAGKHVHRHIWVWQQHHGAVPAGMIVRHINGDTVDDRIENLILVSKAQHAVMNKNGYDLEQANAMLAIGKIKKKIDQLTINKQTHV